MKVGITRDPAITRWIEARVVDHEPIAPYSAKVVATNQAREVQMACALELVGKCVRMTVAARDGAPWAQDHVIRMVFQTAFELGERCMFTVAEDNQPAIRLCRRLGFKQRGLWPRWFEDRAALVFDMLQEDCRWVA